MPTYTIIPNATDITSQSQSQIQTNFQSIQTLIDVNHVDFSDGTNFGKHNFVSFVQQAMDPTTSSTEVALYSKLVSGIVTLFFRPASNGTPIPFGAGSITTASANATPSGKLVTTSTITLPGGLILKWGITSTGTLNANTWNTIPFSPAFPTSCLNVQLTSKSLNPPVTVPPVVSLSVSSILNSGFRVYSASSAVSDITFFAIGN